MPDAGSQYLFGAHIVTTRRKASYFEHGNPISFLSKHQASVGGP